MRKLIVIAMVTLLATVAGIYYATREKPVEERSSLTAYKLINPVTLDGQITGIEWDDAGFENVIFLAPTDELNYSGSIYTKHDDDWLYIAIVVMDSTSHINNHAWVVFDADDDDQILDPWTESKDDAVEIPDSGGTPVSIRMDTATNHEWKDDIDLGGTDDAVVSGKQASGTCTYEMKKKLNSGDAAGNDITLAEGNTILVVFQWGDYETGHMNLSISSSPK